MKNRRVLISTLTVAGLLLAVVGVVFLVQAASRSNQAEPSIDTTTTAEPHEEEQTTPSTTEPTTPDTTSGENAIDPALVATVTIEPLAITVPYLKGTGGFTYEIVRTANGKQTVEFRNDDLKGTKCTDDQGTFAAIAKDPSAAEQETLAKKVTVDGVVYGLSLSAATCTDNPDLLADYQESFSTPFALLKKAD